MQGTDTADGGTAEATAETAPHLRSLEISENIHLFPTPDAASQGSSRRKALLVIGAIIIAGVVGNVALWRSSKPSASSPVPVAIAAPPVASVPEQRLENPITAAAHEIAPLPETARIEITVRPPEAAVTLDGAPAGTNPLTLEVRKDHGKHEVEASAPGFLPFKRTVSFAQDVLLTVELQKAPTGTTSKHRGEVKSRGKTADDPGMSPRPAAKRPVSNIDESDPYAP